MPKKPNKMGQEVPIPIHLRDWIESNMDSLKPPVGNKCVMQDHDFIIMVVAGPNRRKDFHVDPYAEFFYQIKGEIQILIRENETVRTINVQEGEIFLLPACVPHSPQRPVNTIGLVIEHIRKPHEVDGFQWYCENCGMKLHEEAEHISDIKEQLPKIFSRFYKNKDLTMCKHCKTVNQ